MTCVCVVLTQIRHGVVRGAIRFARVAAGGGLAATRHFTIHDYVPYRGAARHVRSGCGDVM